MRIIDTLILFMFKKFDIDIFSLNKNTKENFNKLFLKKFKSKKIKKDTYIYCNNFAFLTYINNNFNIISNTNIIHSKIKELIRFIVSQYIAKL
jgi:hypothetical protein